MQLKFSRTDGRSWTTGLSGLGDNLIAEARNMAKNLTTSCDYIEVIIEQRTGAQSIGTVQYLWTRKQGWTTK